MKMSTLFLGIIFSTTLFSQNFNADSLVKLTMDKMNTIPKYECDIVIHLDVKFINIDKREGKVYFFPPDSINYKIKGFAFLPKKSYNAQAFSLVDEDYIALYLGKETIANHACHIVKVIPNDIESEIVLGQFWIDANNRIRKMTLVTKDEGSYTVFLEYGKEKYAVPSKVTVLFDVKNTELPAAFTGDLEAEESKPKDKNSKSKGTIIIDYSNYKFN